MGGRPSSYGRTIAGARASSYTPTANKKAQGDGVDRYDLEFLRAARLASERGVKIDTFAETYNGPVLAPEEPEEPSEKKQ